MRNAQTQEQMSHISCVIGYKTEWSTWITPSKTLNPFEIFLNHFIKKSLPEHDQQEAGGTRRNATPFNSKTVPIFFTREIWRRLWRCCTLIFCRTSHHFRVCIRTSFAHFSVVFNSILQPTVRSWWCHFQQVCGAACHRWACIWWSSRSFRDFPKQLSCDGGVGNSSGGVNAIRSRPGVADKVISSEDTDIPGICLLKFARC